MKSARQQNEEVWNEMNSRHLSGPYDTGVSVEEAEKRLNQLANGGCKAENVAEAFEQIILTNADGEDTKILCEKVI